MSRFFLCLEAGALAVSQLVLRLWLGAPMVYGAAQTAQWIDSESTQIGMAFGRNRPLHREPVIGR